MICFDQKTLTEYTGSSVDDLRFGMEPLKTVDVAPQQQQDLGGGMNVLGRAREPDDADDLFDEEFRSEVRFGPHFLRERERRTSPDDHDDMRAQARAANRAENAAAQRG